VAELPSFSRGRLIVSVALALALAIAGLQVALVRPYLWPAGAGITLSGDAVFASLGEPQPLRRMRPPDVAAVTGRLVTITQLNTSLGTGAQELTEGTNVTAIYGPGGDRLDLAAGLPDDVSEVLRVWRSAYQLGTTAPVRFRVRDRLEDERIVTLERESAWRSPATRAAWLRLHAGPLLQLMAFLAGALALVALGTSGMTARLMTLALIVTAVATGGPLYGVERTVPLAGEVLLVLVWIATPLAFPIIGLAVLHFPSRASVLDRHRWIYPALALATAPMLGISLLTAAFLLGADVTVPALAWVAARGWTFDLSFAVAVAANLLIVLEGVDRYRANRDANERRRIQIVVYTGVCAVFAYAINNLVPVLSSLGGRPVRLPWLIEGALQAVVLLPAFALPYAVAVRHVFSPRTVLRQGLQYALARRTLSVLVALPVAALVFALVRSRERPLGDIILGQPLFYALCVGLAGLGLRYRDAARRRLDRRFFRAEYDGREILVSLANRVPCETDPAQLVSLVTAQIESALHPEAIVVLAGDDDRLEVISSIGRDVGVLARDGALGTLLRWSERPLEVFLDDDRSPAARLPEGDRAWLAASRLALLVPILAGTGEARVLAGLIGLGQKRSEEPYTPEDRRLLGAIVAQMSVALDLSRLRRRLSTSPAPLEPLTMASGLQGLPAVVDGRYRVEAVIGRGGMGAVFRAHDLRLGRDVAIKVVRTDLVADPDARMRFEREAQIVAKLQHPAIVTVFDYGTLPDGAAFLVLEYVKGEDLRAVLKRERRLSPDRTLALVGSVAAGIDFAHRAGVLHRDLKPENILLPDGGIGAKVLDFGVAKLTDRAAGDPAQTHTQGGTIIGTPAYMAPEQLRGDSVDGRADVYSLAVLTFESLTGRLPFGGGSLVDIGIRQAAGGSAGVNVEGVPPELAPALVRALSWSRDERPATAADFATSLISPSSAGW
jgi:predicted Ser/Thr protein kinase